MFNILIDTCVWLDLAQDSKQAPLIDPLIEMQRAGYINLLVPRLVVLEFQKHKYKIAERAQRSVSTQFNQVKEVIRNVDGDNKKKQKILEYLSDVSHRVPLAGGYAIDTLNRIETLLNSATTIETSDALKVKASNRALNRQAPCHHENKNSMADAVLIEAYFECVEAGKSKDRFAFVTHNKSDFSVIGGNQKLVHPDLAPGFSRIKSLYFISLADCLKRIDPALVHDVIWENSYEPEIRSLTDILIAMDMLTDQVWYNRHKFSEWKILKGRHKIVTRAEWEENWEKNKGYGQTHTIDTIWKGALKSAKRVERKLGKGNIGPWDDFEWGMINGKLSALRWSLGDDWDMLDT